MCKKPAEEEESVSVKSCLRLMEIQLLNSKLLPCYTNRNSFKGHFYYDLINFHSRQPLVSLHFCENHPAFICISLVKVTLLLPNGEQKLFKCSDMQQTYEESNQTKHEVHHTAVFRTQKTAVWCVFYCY